MGQTGHVKIGHNLKGDMCTSKDKLDSIGSKINTDLIEYVPKTLVKKEVIKVPIHIADIFNSIQSLPLTTTNSISNTNNNQRPQVDCFATNLLKCSCADQEVVSD